MNLSALRRVVPVGPPAEIIAVRNEARHDPETGECTGEYGVMEVDVVVRLEEGSQRFTNVKFSNPVPRDYDIIVTLGSPVSLSWRGNELLFFVPWMPKLTDCGATPPGLAEDPMSIDPVVLPSSLTLSTGIGGTSSIPGVGAEV